MYMKYVKWLLHIVDVCCSFCSEMLSGVPIYFSLVDNQKIYIINIHSLAEILRATFFWFEEEIIIRKFMIWRKWNLLLCNIFIREKENLSEGKLLRRGTVSFSRYVEWPCHYGLSYKFTKPGQLYVKV